MRDLYVKVYKDLEFLGFNANEQLIISYILEFQNKNLPCFISDETFASHLNVSEATIKRVIKGLVEKGYLIRKTKNTQTGKERLLEINTYQLEEDLKGVMSRKAQNDPCARLKNDNKTSRKAQNDPCASIQNDLSASIQNDTIKDKRKKEKNLEKKSEDLKDKIEKDSLPSFATRFPGTSLSTLVQSEKAKELEEGIYEIITLNGKVIMRE